MIRMANLVSRHEFQAEATEQRVLEVLRSGRWVGGPVVGEAETAACAVFGRKGAVGTASGTDALILALQVLGIGPGKTVAIPALSFFATAGAVRATGATLCILDVDERGLLCQQALNTAGPHDLVLPVHLFGNACHIQTPLPTVDDAAQAAGCITPAGTLTAVSTYPTKSWSGCGDGGFVLSDDPSLLERITKLGNHGRAGAHLHEQVNGHVGRNSRLDPVSAAVLLGQLPSLEIRQNRRLLIAAAYDDALNGDHQPLLRDPTSAVPTYCLRTPHRSALRSRLHDAQIETAIYYPRPLHHQPALQEGLLCSGAPVAERLCTELLALPLHAGLTDTDVERVVQTLKQA